jgi:hypothetical protein
LNQGRYGAKPAPCRGLDLPPFWTILSVEKAKKVIPTQPEMDQKNLVTEPTHRLAQKERVQVFEPKTLDFIGAEAGICLKSLIFLALRPFTAIHLSH